MYLWLWAELKVRVLYYMLDMLGYDRMRRESIQQTCIRGERGQGQGRQKQHHSLARHKSSLVE